MKRLFFTFCFVAIALAVSAQSGHDLKDDGLHGAVKRVDAVMYEAHYDLSDRLDRTKLIENLGSFFKDEVEQIQLRKEAISKAVGDIDLEVQKSIENLSKHTGTQYQELTDATSKQHLEFMKAIEAQQKALNQKLEETSLIVEELKKLVDVKDSMNKVADATIAQSEKLDQLLKLEESIRAVAT